jgi:hypothetical protein
VRVEEEKPIEAEGMAVVPVFADAEADDHCETPLEAYEDVAVFLDALCGQLGRTRATLRVYDPYYCAGGVVERLGSLGFARVVNVPQDCYATWHAQQYDVLVTNPPYSGSHIERLVSFLAARRLPFAVLVPNFVVKKPFHRTLLEPLRPFYLVPRIRYVYLPPRGARDKRASDTHKKTAPFVTQWHVWAPDVAPLCEAVFQRAKREQLRFDVCRSRNAIRDLRRK